MTLASVPAGDEPVIFAAPDPKTVGNRTAQQAVAILLAHDPRYRYPSKAERQALLVGYAKRGKTLYGAAFDVIRLGAPIDLIDEDAIAAGIDAITICEIKSTNRTAIGSDLKGYFFNITAAELLTAQSVGERYRFLFVNTVTGEHKELALNEVFGRARGMYPAWHIRL